MNTSYLGFEVLTIVLLLTIVFTRILLPVLRKKHACQYILEIGPNWHKCKEGTPTMGGIAPLFAVIIGTVIFALFQKASQPTTDIAPFVLTLLYAVFNSMIGIFDDLAKLLKKENAGLTPWQKLVLQFTFATAYVTLLRVYDIAATTVPIPFTSYSIPLGIFWYPLTILFLTWFVNCANLTDGIDGLASSVGTVIGLFFLILAITTDDISMTLCSAALIGSAFGFFLFNKHPAKIFMGDTGSLFFGALAVGCAFIYGSPLLFLPVGIIYSLEGISVVLQVLYFKITRGKRLFRMAPFHHHLEKGGWSEWSIVLFFCVLTILFSLFAFMGAMR